MTLSDEKVSTPSSSLFPSLSITQSYCTFDRLISAVNHLFASLPNKECFRTFERANTFSISSPSKKKSFRDLNTNNDLWYRGIRLRHTASNQASEILIIKVRIHKLKNISTMTTITDEEEKLNDVIGKDLSLENDL